MNPLSALDGLELEECRDPDDPESEDHCQAPPVYYSRPLDLTIANDFRDTPREKGARGRAVGVRPWSQIVGITWHQTATRDFPASHPGLIHVPAHAMIHRDGSVSLLHHPTAYVYHGHALNRGTIGVEIACRAAGLEGHADTFWRSKEEHARPGATMANLGAEATAAQIAAIPLLMGYYCRLVGHAADRKLGLDPDTAGLLARGQWAHRQGHFSRTSDPGSRIFRAVDAARKDLGLPDVHDRHLGSGRPVESSWLAR